MTTKITSHNSNGEAVFVSDSNAPEMSIPIGTIRFLYSTLSYPLDLSSEPDVETFRASSSRPFFEGNRRNCPDNGTASCIITMQPNANSPLHRSMTLDVVYFLEGKVQATLDSGEQHVFEAGDALVQRATIHAWKNVTPSNGSAKMLIFLQATADTVEVGGKSLTTEWRR